jgi:hypothetical protein
MCQLALLEAPDAAVELCTLGADPSAARSCAAPVAVAEQQQREELLDVV